MRAARGASQPPYGWRLTALGTGLGAPIGIVLALLSGGGGEGVASDGPVFSEAAEAERPNVIVIMTDDEALWGGEATPETNQLIGGQGLTFLNSFVTDPLCCPSRATFLTGQYAHNHGVVSNGGPKALPALRESETLAVWMKDAGYTTALVGKYLNGYEMKDGVPPGWDEWHALVDPTTQNYTEYALNENGKRRHYGPDPKEFKTHVLGSKAVAEIRRAAGGDRPLFLYVGFNAPHAPATAAPRDVGAFAGHRPPDAPNFGERDLSDKPRFIRNHRLSPGLAARVATNQKGVLESLLSVDREVARIIGELERRDELDHTYVFFTSDNGYFAGEHGIEYGKLLPYEAASEVPLMVRGPGIEADSSAEALVGNIDLAPTIAALGGADPTIEMDGRPLPLAEDTTDDTNRPLVIESLVRDRSAYYGIPYAAIRTQRFLYVEYKSGDRELYDYERDPHELRSQHDTAAYADTRAALAAALARIRSCVGEACRAELEAPPEPDTAR